MAVGFGVGRVVVGTAVIVGVIFMVMFVVWFGQSSGFCMQYWLLPFRTTIGEIKSSAVLVLISGIGGRSVHPLVNSVNTRRMLIPTTILSEVIVISRDSFDSVFPKLVHQSCPHDISCYQIVIRDDMIGKDFNGMNAFANSAGFRE